MYSDLQVRTLPQALLCQDTKRSRARSTARRQADRQGLVVNASKKGVGTYYYDHNDKSLAALRPEASWYYTWSSSPANVSGTNTATKGDGLEFVPMIWGVHPDWNQKNGDNRWIDSEIKNLIPNATTLLGYNEPDGKNGGQSDIDVSVAVDNWSKLVVLGKRLGSPATAERATDKDSWMRRFMQKVDKTVAFMCVHWYPGPKTSMTNPEAAAQELADYVTEVNRIWERPVWLTEFAYIDYNQGKTAVYPSDADQVAFAKAAVSKLERWDFVERYAWYALPNGDANAEAAGENNGLFRVNGGMSSVGIAYKDAS